MARDAREDSMARDARAPVSIILTTGTALTSDRSSCSAPTSTAGLGPAPRRVVFITLRVDSRVRSLADADRRGGGTSLSFAFSLLCVSGSRRPRDGRAVRDD